MNAWAIHSELVNQDTYAVSFSSKQRPTIKNGDYIVVVDRLGDREVIFLEYGLAVNTTLEPMPKEGFILSLVIPNPKKLTPERRLTDLAYSLRRVTNYALPGCHFRRKYTSLQNEDFETIIQGRVFWGRTAFGLFVSSLPAATLESFVRYVAVANSRALIERSSFAELWSILRSFLDGQFVAAHDLLEAVSQSSMDLKTQGLDIPFEQLRLGDDGDDQYLDILSVQLDKLTDFLESIKSEGALENSLFSEIDARLSENAITERMFERLFRNTPWPMPKTRF